MIRIRSALKELLGLHQPPPRVVSFTMASKAILGSLVRSPSNRFLRVGFSGSNASIGVRWLSSSQSSSAVAAAKPDEMDKVIERIKRDSKMDDRDRLINELRGKVKVMKWKLWGMRGFAITFTIVTLSSALIGEGNSGKDKSSAS